MQIRLVKHAKLLLATLAFIGSLGSLIVSTVAWFSASSFLELTTFRIRMGTEAKLEIGLKVPIDNPVLGEPGSIVYYESIDDAILLNHAAYSPWTPFKAVSSMFQSLWLTETTDLADPTLFPVLRSQYRPSTNRHESEVATTGFYQFEFYMRSDVRINLFLDPATFLYANQVKNNQTALRYNLKATELNQIAQAMRISFLSKDGFIIYEPNVATSSEVSFGGRLDVLQSDHYYDYDSETKREYMFGEYNDASYLVYDDSARVTEVTNYSSFIAKTRDNVTPLSIPLSKENGLVVASEVTYTKAEMTNFSNEDAVLVRLYPNEPARLVVTIYAEGWDHDVSNNINYSAFLMNLVFGGQYAPL